jgi:two-component system, OmpR family, sensor kinase
VLRGELATRVAEQSAGQARQTAWLVVLASALLLGGAMTMALQHQVTRRLRRLAGELATFRPGVADQASAGTQGDEIDQLCGDARALQHRVQQQIRQLEDSDRQRRELISNISHDLHTPLANIRGWLDTLLISGERLSSQERERHLRTAARHCAGLGRRVAELFELASLDSARTVAHPEPFCMADLVSDVIQAHQLGAEQQGVSLRLANEADLQAGVLADIGLIERVLSNLVDNALRHTVRGGQIELTVHAQGDEILVRVADDGRGIAASDLPHVFERYWTTRSTTTQEQAPAMPGTHRPAVSSGLGLAIARRIVELHGGTISATSGEREGSEFTFSLPALHIA